MVYRVRLCTPWLEFFDLAPNTGHDAVVEMLESGRGM
jgi:hypothetical protein